jgi:hypothetical protein
MVTSNLLASLLVAASVSFSVETQTTDAGVNAPARQTVATQDPTVPAFSIDERGVLHGQDVSDQSQAPWNLNCVC